MTTRMILCEYCHTPHHVENKIGALSCEKCGAPLRLNYDYDPRGVTFRALDAVRSLVASEWEVLGVDVSKWQGTINWDKLATKVQFAFIKSTEGTKGVDPYWEINAREADRVEVVHGVYHFCKPDKDPKGSGQNFAEHVSGVLPAVMDIEQDGGLDKQGLENWMQKFVKAYSEVTDHPLGIVYTAPYFFNSNVPRGSWKNYLLWVAHWTSASQPVLPEEWTDIHNPKTWTFWQHSAKGDGFAYGAQSANIDLDRYNGSVTDFNRQFGTNIKPIGEPTPPEPPPFRVPEYVVITASVLNVRDKPTASGSSVKAQTKLGTVWRTTSLWAEDATPGRYWYQVADDQGQELWLAGWWTREL